MDTYKNRKCWVMHTHDYSGIETMRVFLDVKKAVRALELDVDDAAALMNSEGYIPSVIKNKYDAEVYVTDTDIFFEWHIEESEIEE